MPMARRPRSHAGAQPFELLEPITLYTAHNAIAFHTWSDDECCLPQGATHAFLRDDDANRLRLRVGDVLILEALEKHDDRRGGRCRSAAAHRGAPDARRSARRR